MEVIKLKRQIRDWLNKRVHDEQTLKEVGKVIGFRKGINHNDIYGSATIHRERCNRHNCKGQ
jgi:hypothetical protein